MTPLAAPRSLGRWLLQAGRARGGWPSLGVLVVFALLARLPPGGPVTPARGDVPDYLSGAWHILRQGTYSNASAAGPVPATLGREPAYPFVLAGVMAADPAFSRFTPACLRRDDACPRSMFRAPRLLNAGFILGTALALFLLGRGLTAEPWAGLAGAAYLLLNAHMNKGWGDLMSDRLAVLLVALFMLILAAGWRRRSPALLGLAGLVFGMLTLTKAIFLLFAVLGAAAAVLALWRRPRLLRLILPPALAFAVLAGGWTARNWVVSGMPRLTDARSGIALSTRAVFDTMTARQYAASLVFWTGTDGARLATHWFGHGTADPFDLRTPGGYYDVGQNGYGARVAARMRRTGEPYWRATAAVDRAIEGEIWRHKWGYLASMLPLTWRGLWVDEFPWLGLPCFGLALWRAARARDGLVLVLLGLGAFNMLAYAALSLNIERYQLTAMPAVALSVALVAGRWRRGGTSNAA